jgi:2-phosphoglycerate kinase
VQTLTIDDLRTAILGVTSKETRPDLHRVGMPNHIKYFTRTDPDQMIEDALAQHRAMWPAILRVIRKRSHSRHGYVIDGWHLLPTEVSRIADGNVRPVWLDVDARVLEQRERAIWDFYAPSPEPERMFAHFLERSVRWNDLVCNQARVLGLHVISQDGSKSPEDLCSEILDPL